LIKYVRISFDLYKKNKQTKTPFRAGDRQKVSKESQPSQKLSQRFNISLNKDRVCLVIAASLSVL
jgi:hypothetical protein